MCGTFETFHYSHDALRNYTKLSYIACLYFTVRKQNYNNPYKFLGFRASFVQLIVAFLGLLPDVVYVVCSSETSEQTDCIIRYINPKGCHHKKIVFISLLRKKAESIVMFPCTVYYSSITNTAI
jgi:phosphopantetheine adenylyltransferase